MAMRVLFSIGNRIMPHPVSVCAGIPRTAVGRVRIVPWYARSGTCPAPYPSRSSPMYRATVEPIR
jgi:hypothetical protein